MSRPREIELKLEVAAAGLDRLKRNRLLRAGITSRQQLRSVYYDTPKHVLAKAGITLRVRTVDGRHVQTVKSAAGAAAGLFDRQEWECDVAGPSPDLAAAEGPLRGLARRHAVRKNLGPIFETEVERTLSHVSRDGAEIEIALDEGEVRAGSRSAPVHELELELKSGPPEALFALAGECNRTVPLRLGVQSKSERGFALLRGRTKRIVKAEPVALSAQMSTAEGFRTIVRACIRHFRLNEPALTESRDAEALHQVRVAMRRLRSAFSLFNDVVSDDAAGSLRQRLQRVSQDLGAARNLDVFLADCRAGRLAGPAAADLAPRARREREHAYERVVATLGSQDFRALMIDIAAWIEHGPWTRATQTAEARDGRLADFARGVLDAWRHKVEKKGARLKRLSPEQRHRVRIAAKKLRYATEFFAALHGEPKACRRRAAFLAALEDVQGKLGALNDIAASRHLAEDLWRQPSGAVPPDAEGVWARPPTPERGQDTAALVAAATKAYGKLVKAKPFWA